MRRIPPAGEPHRILRGVGLSPAGLGAEGNINTIAIDGTVLIDWIADFIVDGPSWPDLVAPEA